MADPGGDVGTGVVAACQFTPQQVNPTDGEGEHQHNQQHRYLQHRGNEVTHSLFSLTF